MQQWEEEVRKFAPKLRVHVLYQGAGGGRDAALRELERVTIAGGAIVILETQGTAVDAPQPFALLDSAGLHEQVNSTSAQLAALEDEASDLEGDGGLGPDQVSAGS